MPAFIRSWAQFGLPTESWWTLWAMPGSKSGAIIAVILLLLGPQVIAQMQSNHLGAARITEMLSGRVCKTKRAGGLATSLQTVWTTTWWCAELEDQKMLLHMPNGCWMGAGPLCCKLLVIIPDKLYSWQMSGQLGPYVDCNLVWRSGSDRCSDTAWTVGLSCNLIWGCRSLLHQESRHLGSAHYSSRWDAESVVWAGEFDDLLADYDARVSASLGLQGLVPSNRSLMPAHS